MQKACYVLASYSLSMDKEQVKGKLLNSSLKIAGKKSQVIKLAKTYDLQQGPGMRLFAGMHIKHLTENQDNKKQV